MIKANKVQQNAIPELTEKINKGEVAVSTAFSQTSRCNSGPNFAKGRIWLSAVGMGPIGPKLVVIYAIWIILLAYRLWIPHLSTQ